MQTKQQIEQTFRAELQALLDKYGAELEAKDHYQGWAECGEDVRITVYIPAIWDKDGEPVREYTEIDLGRHLCPTPNDGLGGSFTEKNMDITEKLRELIPDGYGYNSEFAHTMEAAAVEIERLQQVSDVLREELKEMSVIRGIDDRFNQADTSKGV